MKHRVKRVHFVGIGGIGMSGIAEVLLNLGYEVSGSDVRESATTRRLVELGARVAVGHSAANLSGADVVVMSSAVKPDNPEIAAARQAGIPVIPRAEMLAELERMKRGIAVAGSHGKTTTTCMIAAILSRAGLDPTAVIGGRLNIFGSNAKLGQGEWMVAEADESDGSFLHLSPTIVVVTNIDREHMDHYQSLDRLYDTFVQFMNRVPFYGLVVAGADDPPFRALLPRVHRRVFTYGTSPAAGLRAVDIKCRGLSCEFMVEAEGKTLGRIQLGMPGTHNAYNALAALAVAAELEIDFPLAAEALQGFNGVGRRFEIKGEAGGVMVIDDYGHHPTEIRATLKAAREFLRTSDRPKTARLITAFQPHRYTRTQDLWEEFLNSFFEPDLLVLTEIYAASEPPIPGISGAALYREVAARRMERGLPTWFASDRGEITEILFREARPGDVVLTLGAGNLWRHGEELLERLGEKNERAASSL